MLGYCLDVCRHGRIQLLGGLRVDGDFDTEAFDPFRMLWQKRWMATKPFDFGGVVELVGGVKDWERFGTDNLTCPNYCVIERSGVRRYLGLCVYTAAQYQLLGTVEQRSVDSAADFCW